MGFLDEVKKAEGEALRLAEEHKDVVEQGIQKAADLVDDQTGHKYSSKIDTVERQAQSLVRKLDEQAPAAKPSARRRAKPKK